MTSFVDLPVVLAAQIQAAVEATTVALTCAPTRYTPTAGEPAAPSGEGCPAIWVWIDRIFANDQPVNLRGEGVACAVTTALTLNVRVDACYLERDDGSDQSDTEHLAAADCLHGLMGVIWCALADHVAAGTLLDVGDCRGAALGSFQVGQRSGGYVSATIPVTVEWDCADNTAGS
jgi:hypothetical protein